MSSKQPLKAEYRRVAESYGFNVNFKSKNWLKQFKHEMDITYESIGGTQCFLTETFIETHLDSINFSAISDSQKLTESFIEKHLDKLDVYYILKYQKLSQKFIEKHLKKFETEWSGSIATILKYQKVNLSFIKRHAKTKLHKDTYSRYQRLPAKFIEDNNIRITKNNWMYKDIKFKEKYIKEKTDYPIFSDKHGKYIIAYKGIRKNRYSAYNYQYKYLKGQTYEAHCDCNADDCASFGLSAWNYAYAEDYCNDLVVKVKIYIKDIGCIVNHDKNKIRCRKMTILS